MKNSYNKILIPFIVLLLIILSVSSVLMLDRGEVFSKVDLKMIDVRDYTEFDAHNLNSDYDLIFATVEQLSTDSIGLLNDNKKAIFIFDKDKDLIANNILSEKIKGFNGKDLPKLSELNECYFVGYYISNNKILPWYLHEDANEEILLEDIKDLALYDLKQNNNSTRQSDVDSDLNKIDEQVLRITYEEAKIGVLALMFGESKANSATTNYRLELEPRKDSQYYDYQTEYFLIKQDYSNCKGGLMSYNPLNVEDILTVKIAYPYFINISVDSVGEIDEITTSGGIGDDYVSWEFKAKKLNHDKRLFGETVTEFMSRTNKRECDIEFTLYLRKTDKRTGESRIRKYSSEIIMNER